MTPDERIAELEARLAMAVEALKAAEKFIDYVDQKIPLGIERSEECVAVSVQIENALATAPDLAAFLQRVGDRGAAKELRDLAAELRRSAVEVPHPQNQHEWRVGYAVSLERRAAELEGP